MAVLGYLTKLKMDLGLVFGAHFLHDFFHKNVPYLILMFLIPLSMVKVSMSHLISFS